MKTLKQQSKKTQLLVMFLLICGVFCVALWLFSALGERGLSPINSAAGVDSQWKTEDAFVEPEIPERVLENDILLPVGMLLTTKARAAYEDGTMRLVIPRLNLDCTVGADTLEENLEHGPGLYKYSQMPDIYNTNVSIAAHRDLAGCEFYYLDTVQEGDFIYLIYKGNVFQYAYRSTKIVEETDWEPIRTCLDCRVTLTTCDPIGTSLRRMIVIGELIDWRDYSEDYEFL